MIPITNPSHLQNICYDCGISGFVPNATYTYNSSNGQVVVTDASTYPSGDGLKRMQISVMDRDGKEVRGWIGPNIAAINVTAGGSGYTSAPTVAFTGGGGTGAAGTAVIAGGVVTGITITNPGTGYTSAPTIALSGGGGTSAAATAVVNNTNVTIDGSTLNRSKPLNINATIVTNNNIQADGSVWGTGASGVFGTWDAAQQAATPVYTAP